MRYRQSETAEAVTLTPASDPHATVIWLHGLGADGFDFVPLVPELALLDSFAVRFVFPHAPVRPVTVNNGFAMRAWYDIKALSSSALAGPGMEDAAGIRASGEQIRALVDAQVASGIDARKVVVAGFSQGGAVALQAGLRHPTRLGGILALSTYLPLRDVVAQEVSPANRDLPILMCHGTADPIVPATLGERSRDTLKDLGFPVEWRSYPMQHQVCAEEIADIREWLVARLQLHCRTHYNFRPGTHGHFPSSSLSSVEVTSVAIREQLIEYRDGDTVLEGVFCYDDARPGPLPAVLISHAWNGRDEFASRRAHRLAWHGYAAFALDMFGKGKRGSTVEECQALIGPFMGDRAKLATRIQAAVSTVKALPQVDARRVAAIGFCFGGLCVLDLARSGADVRGVVSFHGLLPPTGLPAARITSKVLILHGNDDPMAPTEAVVAIGKELSAAGADWQLHNYGGTMHAFTNPEANNPAFGTLYNSAADRRSWKSLLNFLEEVLR